MMHSFLHINMYKSIVSVVIYVTRWHLSLHIVISTHGSIIYIIWISADSIPRQTWEIIIVLFWGSNDLSVLFHLVPGLAE
jgi:hypothetical protein